MEHIFILNPTAGKGKNLEATIKTIETTMKSHHLPYKILTTQYPKHGTLLVSQAVQGGQAVRIYACGGDGTLNECMAGMAGYPNAALTHFPTGSGNDFLRMFGEDKEQFFTLSNLLDPHVVPIDLMECNGRPVLNICSVGLDARIGIGMSRFKSLPLVSGPMAYQLSVLREVLTGVHQPYRVTIDGIPIDGHRFAMICICNGQYYGGGFNPTPKASPNDGMLDCIVVDGVSRLKIASLVGAYAKGLGDQMPEIHTFHGRTITITCQKDNVINIDGECMVAKEITISLSCKQVNFFYPKTAHWHGLVTQSTCATSP